MQSLKEQFETVQSYVCSLFDSIPKVQLSHSNSPDQLIEQVIQQNMNYGRKIIQLSGKFTAKYRKDHFIDRKDIEHKIGQIYQILINDQKYNSTMDEMVDSILHTALLQKQNNERRSKENQIQKIQVIGEVQKITQGNIRKKSTTRIKSKKQETFTTKTVLQIKGYFEQQQNQIRNIFECLRRTCETKRINLSQQKTKYTKIINQNESHNLIELVKAGTQNNMQNIVKIKEGIDFLIDAYDKKIHNQGISQGRFNSYRQEIERRQDVYSYAVSKMLQNINNLRNLLLKKQLEQCSRIINNLQDIGQKFYELYPSGKIIKDLQPLKQITESSKSQGIQVNIAKVDKTKQNQTKRYQLQVFKIVLRITQYLDKFDRNIKHRKLIQYKEIQRFIQGIKQSLPKRTSLDKNNTQLNAYQIQLKKIMEDNQKNQKQITEEFNKRTKKQQKKLTQLQKALQETLNEMKNYKDHKEQQIKKLHKKNEQERNEAKKLQAQKEHLQKNLDDLIAQTNRLRSCVKSQHQTYQIGQKNLMNQKQQLQQNLEDKNQKLSKYQIIITQEREKINEERKIYKQKIIMLQSKQQEHEILLMKCQEELDINIKDNTILNKQIEELTELYEQKIKQFEDMINDVKNLEQDLNNKESMYLQLSQKNNVQLSFLKRQQKQLQNMTKLNQQLKFQIQNVKKENDRIKQIGCLNNEDILLLKQQMQKVRCAYFESQQQLQNIRLYNRQLQNEKNQILRQKNKVNKVIQQLQINLQSQRFVAQKIEREMLSYKEQLSLKTKQYFEKNRQMEDYKRQSVKLRKQCSQLRDLSTKTQNQFREVRQELQRKKQQQGLDNGKKKLELQALKVQLRRKTEQFQKQKQHYQQEIQILRYKNNQMQELMTQKQILMRITNQHVTN